MTRDSTELEVDQSSRSIDLHTSFHDPGPHHTHHPPHTQHHHPPSMLSSSSSSSTSIAGGANNTTVSGTSHQLHGYVLRSISDTNSLIMESSRPPATSASSLSIPSLSITTPNDQQQQRLQLQSQSQPTVLENQSLSTTSCKRSSSSSNDLLYERDRFRARVRSFNVSFPNKEDYTHGAHIDTETARNVASSDYCSCQNEPASLEGDINPCDVCDGI